MISGERFFSWSMFRSTDFFGGFDPLEKIRNYRHATENIKCPFIIGRDETNDEATDDHHFISKGTGENDVQL